MKDVVLKRGPSGPLFFIGIGFAIALLVPASNNYLIWWGGILLLSLGWLSGKNESFEITSLGTVFLLFLAILFLNILFVGAVQITDGLFVISYLLFGFLCITVLNNDQILSVFRIVVAVFSCLALWGIIQFTFGEGLLRNFGSSAHTLFATPNSYAAAINLVLFPLLALYMAGKSSKFLYVSITLLFAGLITTQSRGGWVAFLIALIFLLLLVKYVYRNYTSQHVYRLIAGGVVIMVILFVTKSSHELLNQDVAISADEQLVIYKDIASDLVPVAGIAASGSHRIDLYRVAIANMLENPLFGIGYYHFYYYLHRDMSERIEYVSRYVHNDYLQIGLETGTVGLVLLLLLIGLVFWQGIFTMKQLPENEQVILVGLLVSLTAYFAHAIVDFVMYVPVLVLMSGAYIAMVSRLTSTQFKITFPSWMYYFSTSKWIRPQAVKFIFCLTVLAFLFQPVFAQVCYNAANNELDKSNHGLALNLFEIARRFSPGQVKYYQTEANYWRDIAIIKSDKKAAKHADDLYRDAASANKFDPDSRLERAVLHRDWSNLLSNPAGGQKIISWFEYILEWRPHYNRVQAEYVRTLFQYGFTEQAINKLLEYLSKYPNSSYLVAVHNELMSK